MIKMAISSRHDSVKWAAVVSVLLFNGCGGGGSGSDTPSPMQNLQSAPTPSQPWDVSSTTLMATDSSGNSYSATYSSTPGGSGMFNGQTANTSLIGLTVSENGTVIATEDSTAYYLATPYTPLGDSGTTSGMAWVAVITGYTPLPSMLTVGASGPLSSATYQDGMGNVIGSLTETYTVTADSPDALFLNVDAAGSINGVQETETLTYSIPSDGSAATLVQVQITLNGTTLTFQ
jgi:hypothetical protein